MSHTNAAALPTPTDTTGDICPCVFLFGIIGGFAPMAVQGEITAASFLCAGVGALVGLVFAYK